MRCKIWEKTHLLSLKKKKKLMLSPLVLEHFDPSETLVVSADASFTDIGGILLHHADNDRTHVVYHISA